MLRVIAWGIWIQLLVFALDLSIISIPHRLTEKKAQMQISSLRTAGKTGATWTYAVGKIAGRDKPVHMTVSSLLRKKTKKYGESLQSFKAKYVGTGELIDVTVGTSWLATYDVAYADFQGRSEMRYSIVELVAIDTILLFILITLYAYLRHTRPPAPPETPYNNQPGGF